MNATRPPPVSDSAMDVTLFAVAAACGVLAASGAALIAREAGYSLATGLAQAGSADAFTQFAVAWWIIAGTALGAGFGVARLLHRSVLGNHIALARNVLIGGIVIAAAVVGQNAIAPSGPAMAGFAASLVNLLLATIMAAAGAYFAMRRA